ncbi:unnamed protein product, partial [Sphagnum balticum]
FPQITRPYCLRYGAGNAFNQSGSRRPPPRCGAGEVEAPLPGHGDTAARVPDHRPRDLQHQAAAKSGAPQKRLAETVITLPGTTIEEEFRRRNAAIDVVAAYCHFQEGGAAAIPRKRSSTRRTSPTPSREASPQLTAAEAEKQALSDAMLLVFTEKRTTTCFVCLGEQTLPFEKRTYKFASPGDLTKHFKRKHLAHIKEGDRPKCKVCRMGLQHKQHLQNHAESIHGTVS